MIYLKNGRKGKFRNMASREALINGMDNIAAAYGSKFVFEVDSDSELKLRIIQVWSKHFEKFSDQCFLKSVDYWIGANPKAPAISDLRRMCDQTQEELGEKTWQR